MNIDLFRSKLEELGILLSESQMDAFVQFEDALYTANEVMNLTRVPRGECWSRHFLDSLLMQDLLPQGAKVMDIGTGPGVPAWPLACARPDLEVTAMDSNGKMLGFLTSQPLPNLHPVNARAEEWNEREKFDIVTGRAVAPLSSQLEISAAFCKKGGKVIPMRTTADLDLLEDIDLKILGLKFGNSIARTLPGTDSVRLFPVYEKVRTTAKGYPRRWAEIKKKPL